MRHIRVGKRHHVALVDDEDYAELSKFTWSLKVRPENRGFYAVTEVREGGKRRKIAMHRMLLGLGPEQISDHEDGNGLNNQRSNLRPATHPQNMKNRWKRKNSAISPYKGVRLEGAWWKSTITVDKKIHQLGRFATAEEAARAYDDAARQHFGTFARVNFPRSGENGALHPALGEVEHLPALVADERRRLRWLREKSSGPLQVSSPAELLLWRKSRGWSQDEAALHLGVSRASICGWERGRLPLPRWMRKT